LTVLTDSLAASFSVLFLASLILALADLDRRRLYIALGCIFLLLAALLRVDKVYWGASVVIIFIGVLVVRYRRACIGSVAYTILFFGFAVACLSLINAKTTVFNEARPPLDVRSMLFNRVVWPRMTESYEYYPDEVKQRVSRVDASEFDSHNNYVFPFLIKHLKEEDGGQMVWSMTKTTFAHFPMQVVMRAGFDFTKYSLPNFAFPLEALNVLPESVATDWTVSRMSMATPILSRAFLWLGTGVFFIAFVVLLVTWWRVRYENGPDSRFSELSRGSMVLLAGAILANSGLFALSFGMDAHIRYALPSYTVIVVLVFSLWISRMYKFNLSSSELPRDEIHDHSVDFRVS